jgi:hypothetical protein
MASVAALNLLDALADPGDRWEALDGRHKLRTHFQGAYRKTSEGVDFDTALAELVNPGVIRESASYQVCPQCGLRWLDGETETPDTPTQRDCAHPALEHHIDYVVELGALQTFLGNVITTRWNAKDLKWNRVSDEVRLSGTVQDQAFEILWFPDSAGDPLRDTFRAQSSPSTGAGWIYPDVCWIDLIRKPLEEEILTRIRCGIAALVTWNDVKKLSDQEAAVLGRLIRGLLGRCASSISTPPPKFSDAVTAVFPGAAPSGWAVGSAQIYLETPASVGVATGCLVTMAGSRRDRLAAHTLATHLRQQVEDWQNRRAKGSRVLIALGSMQAVWTLIGVAAATVVTSGLTLLREPGAAAPIIQAVALVVSIVVFVGLSLYLLITGFGLGRPFVLPAGWENTPTA